MLCHRLALLTKHNKLLKLAPRRRQVFDRIILIYSIRNWKGNNNKLIEGISNIKRT